MPSTATVQQKSDLFERVKAGDEAAFQELYNLYHSRVAGAIRRYIKESDTVDFIANGVFAKIWQVRNSFSTYQGNSSLSTWITKIAINEALMYLRRGQTERRYPIVSLDAEFTDSGMGHEFDIETHDHKLEGLFDRQELELALAQLPEKYRQIINLRLVEGLTIEETCDFLNLSMATVKSRLHRSRVLIQVFLDSKRKFSKRLAKR